MDKKSKLKELLNRLDSLEGGLPTGEIKSLTDRLIGDEVKALESKLRDNPTIKYLDSINTRLNQFKKDFNLAPVVKELNALIGDVSKAKEDTKKEFETSNKASETKLTDLKAEIIKELSKTGGEAQKFTKTSVAPLVESIKKLEKELSSAGRNSEGKVTSLNKVIKDIDDRLNTVVLDLQKSVIAGNDLVVAAAAEVYDKSIEAIEKLRMELLSMIGHMGATGGGNANRNIAIGGNASVLSKYTDINLKAGSNVTITYTNNDSSKYTDVTISSSGGGGGSVGGVVRSINSINTSQTAGNDAGTDYVYVCTAGVRLELPTAVDNTNLYTVKNTSNSSVLVTTTGAETIDDDSNAILSVKYTSVDLISDDTNWKIT